ncbi:MAG: aminomethyltransferase family protein [candidate division KSB1 bacterium]|nr:aminomethyltransferase family protein [candidate division KSB1 bacterium]
MNKLPLSHFHTQHAVACIELAGYEVPAYYRDLAEEFEISRTLAITDRSFVGKLRVFGKDRIALLHRLTTNEMRYLKVGEGIVNIFTNAKGRVVDVVEMFMDTESIFMLTSPGRTAILKAWIEKYTFLEEVRCEEVTSQYGVIAFLGKNSSARLQALFGGNVENLPSQHAQTFDWNNERVIVHRSGHLTPAAFHLIVPAAVTTQLWERLTSEIKPVGYSAYEMLRIHRGLPAVGKEITEEYNPHEVGLYPFINFEKGCYIGQEVIARLDTYQKVQRQLVGLNLETEVDSNKDWHGANAPIFVGDQHAGQLSSVCFSPSLGHAIGLGVVRKPFATPEARVEIRWPERAVVASIQQLPFV